LSIEIHYRSRCEMKSDINEHLPLLRIYGSLVDHITEFGVRHGNSTVALLASKPKKMISYDWKEFNQYPKFRDLVARDTEFVFIQADVREIEIEPTDLLFIDTVHTYEQLSVELKKHAGRVRRYIILHDTHTTDPTGSIPGMWKAIGELMGTGKWRIDCDYENNNGLTVLERIAS